MKNLTKSLLATLMLIGFSTSVLATVDCTGLQKKNRVNGELTRANIGSEYYQCKMANRNGHTWTFVSSEREIRYQNQKWDGVRRYEGADNSSANSIQAPSQKVEVVVKKSEGQKATELYRAFTDYDYSYDKAMDKIYAFCKSLNCPDEIWLAVKNHIEGLSMKQIKVLARKKAYYDDIVVFIKTGSHRLMAAKN